MADGRHDKLALLEAEIGACHGCSLADTRGNVVAGSGDPAAQVMFVGEAPGYHEDRQGVPFVGQAGKLLDQLLARIGLTRGDVFIANVLKCRPPDNRDPAPEEIERCRKFLERQIGIIQPLVVCTMGNFATRLLTGSSDGISRLHGRTQPMPGHENTSIFPVFHPAAALYTRSNMALLEQDFDKLASLLPSGKDEAEVEVVAPKADVALETDNGKPEPEQLGLF